ncbi:DNA-3-methyladenine glycosylase II [Streptomyces sp. DfronAA-171]|nr:DNA-3-methyladenine glycosylase II [Streptomyces sp. DfronAA-171]
MTSAVVSGPQGGLHADRDRCVRAVRSRDARFDGWFFTAVTSTGIYCRPSCPALTPRPENMVFLPSAAACQQAGFRACKRCRPDASSGSPEWNHRADLVARAMRLVADGVVDREGVPGLAARLGYSARQVERQLNAELGAGPLALARAQRAQTARLLVETTTLPMADIAFASGFSSIRTFNETVQEVYALAPSALRARAGGTAEPGAGTVRLRLPLRGPFTPDNLFGHLAATAVPGVEEWRDGAYRRTLDLPHGPGIVALSPLPEYVDCRLRLRELRDLPAAISRCRRLLDLDADPEAVDTVLAADPDLAPLVRKAPGRRVPRTTDEAEFAVRAVLGQQVSTAAARTHAGRLAASYGTPVEDPDGGLTHLFPGPAALAALDPEQLAMPRSRRRTLTGLVDALAGGHARARRGQRLGPRPRAARRAARHRPLDRRGHRHAGARRPRRLPRHRSRRPPGRRSARPARHPGGAHPPRRRLAPLARLCDAVPVGDVHAPHQRHARFLIPPPA